MSMNADSPAYPESNGTAATAGPPKYVSASANVTMQALSLRSIRLPFLSATRRTRVVELRGHLRRIERRCRRRLLGRVGLLLRDPEDRAGFGVELGVLVEGFPLLVARDLG